MVQKKFSNFLIINFAYLSDEEMLSSKALSY